MAKKKSFFGTLLKLGDLAAAGYAIYTKRDEIKSFVTEAAERIFPEEPETLDPEEILDVEPDVIIDSTAKAAAEEVSHEEDAPEA